MKSYTYYVSFMGMNSSKLAVSNCFINRVKKISTMDDVLEITKNLSKGIYSDVTIIGWTLLEC